jgi:mediator of RNA polymerase II transcription subunit 24
VSTFKPFRNSEMIEPQSRILAKLCVYCIISALYAPTARGGNKKRSTDPEDSILCPPKVRKTNPDVSTDSCSNDFPENIPSSEPLNSVREPLATALQQLLKIFSTYVVTDDLSPKIYFIFQFMSLLVQCGGDRIKPVLRLIPNGLIQNILKIIPVEDLTMGFVVRSYDLGLVTGRQAAITDLCLLRNIQIRRDSIKL